MRNIYEEAGRARKVIALIATIVANAPKDATPSSIADTLDLMTGEERVRAGRLAGIEAGPEAWAIVVATFRGERTRMPRAA